MKQLNWYQIFGNTHKIPDGRTVMPTDDIQIWLNCANIWDKSYTTLAEILADTDTLLALITSNNAVDYMVRSTTWATQITVPTMTDNTHPSGVCFASSEYSSRGAFTAFDGTSNAWQTSNTGTSFSNIYVGYEFTSAVNIEKAVFAVGTPQVTAMTYKFQGSNDGNDWHDLTSNLTVYSTSPTTVTFEYPGNYSHYRMLIVSQTHSSSERGGMISTLQFYSASITTNATAMTYIGQNNYASNTLLADATWCNAICNSEYFESVLNVKVPTMTGYTTPSGEVRVNNIEGSKYGWLAYDNNHSTFWSANARQTTAGVSAYGWNEYNFGKSVYIAMAHIYTVSAVIRNLEVQTSDDGVTYTKVQDYTSASTATATEVFQKVIMDTHNEAKIWRLYYNVYHPADGFWPNANTIQFYGREDV